MFGKLRNILIELVILIIRYALTATGVFFIASAFFTPVGWIMAAVIAVTINTMISLVLGLIGAVIMALLPD